MRVIFAVILCCFLALPSYAQEASPGFQERLDLSAKMHEIRPAKKQVEDAVAQVALNLPQGDREEFQKEILSGFNFEELEALSIKSMAEVFTADELKAMIAYFGSEEAQSISEKLPLYEELVQPKILTMLDAALMKLRAGTAQ